MSDEQPKHAIGDSYQRLDKSTKVHDFKFLPQIDRMAIARGDDAAAQQQLRKHALLRVA